MTISSHMSDRIENKKCRDFIQKRKRVFQIIRRRLLFMENFKDVEVQWTKLSEWCWHVSYVLQLSQIHYHKYWTTIIIILCITKYYFVLSVVKGPNQKYNYKSNSPYTTRICEGIVLIFFITLSHFFCAFLVRARRSIPRICCLAFGVISASMFYDLTVFPIMVPSTRTSARNLSLIQQ